MPIRNDKFYLRPAKFGLLTGSLLFAITAFIALQDQLSILDQRLFNYIYDLPEILRPLLLIATQFGSFWVLAIVTAIAWLSRRRRLSVWLLSLGLLTIGITELAKFLIQRPRPLFYFPELLSREIHVYGMGFPSGHTALATVLSLTLLPHVPRRYRFLVPLWIAVVGLSRIYLGVHAPLDVIGGFSLGLIIATAAYLLVGDRRAIER